MKPNPIDPPTFAKLKEGYAMLIFVCVIFLLYFIALLWARRADRADIIKVAELGYLTIPKHPAAKPFAQIDLIHVYYTNYLLPVKLPARPSRLSFSEVKEMAFNLKIKIKIKLLN